ncbi:ester cyclase [Candidatus Bipolaricaulota bacterium]
MAEQLEAHKATATRFIEAFNTDDWDTVREVVAEEYVFHHPVGGTVHAGPDGMVGVWSEFKSSLSDSWHPIPVMIAEGDHLAVLLPTYGNFTGKPYHGAQPTGKWLEYGMVNIVRFEGGKLVENWFGMDPVVERQQMGAAPSRSPRQLTASESRAIDLFRRSALSAGREFDHVTAFGDVVVALGPPQFERDTSIRKVDVYHVAGDSFEQVYAHEFTTNPPYAGDPRADLEASRAVVKRLFEKVLVGHELEAMAEISSPHILIHPTAMPCEASYYGVDGTGRWLSEQWGAFPDLTPNIEFTVAQGDIVAVHWMAKGTQEGQFMMVPPTGKPVQYTGASMYRIEDGRIAEIWETRNTLSILSQLNPEMLGGHHAQ